MGWERENTQGNLWQTFIESMLIKNGEENAFLATNCRAENIVSEGKIFGGKLADVSVIKGWDKNLIIRAGPGLYHPFRPGQSKTFHCAKFEYGVKVVGNETKIRKWSFDEVYRELQEGILGNDLFWKVKYKYHGDDYEIISSLRYINFSRSASQQKYIQPISGYVLFEDSEIFFIACLAANILPSGKVNAEILKRIPINLFDTKEFIGGLSIRLLRILSIPLKWLFLTDEFADSVKIDATVEFFTYEQRN